MGRSGQLHVFLTMGPSLGLYSFLFCNEDKKSQDDWLMLGFRV